MASNLSCYHCYCYAVNYKSGEIEGIWNIICLGYKYSKEKFSFTAKNIEKYTGLKNVVITGFKEEE